MNLAGMENARQGFEMANTWLENQGRQPAFDITLISDEKEVALNNGRYTIKADNLINDVTSSDIVIIPPVVGHPAMAIQENKDLIPWIIKQYHSGAEIVSLCLGAFILGSTGLLNNKSCVTHWRAAEDLKRLFPDVDVITNKVLTDERRIYTGGGAFSSANLILYLITKYVGREAAIYCSKIFQIDMSRTSQSPFIIFSGQKDHGDDTIAAVQTHIELHFNDKITIPELCNKFAIGRRTFERRFKKATGDTTYEYIRKVKVEAAKKQLESGEVTIQDVMFEVGYTDSKAFREVFKKVTGLTPLDYKNKYLLKQPA